MNNIDTINNWKEFIQRVFTEAKQSSMHHGSPVFYPPSIDISITEVESALRVTIPSEFKSLLVETNGITENLEIKGEVIEAGYLIWTLERIKCENLEYRTLPIYKETFMPFECLLFFADSGFGDNFGYAVVGGVVQRSAIYVWNHENDSRIWVAPSLRCFIE